MSSPTTWELPTVWLRLVFYSVMSLPTVLVEDAMENGLGEWRGDVPKVEEVLTAVRSA